MNTATEPLGTGRTAGANLMGSDLYSNLIKYLTSHLKQVKELSDPLYDLQLLQFYAAEWDRFTTAASYVDRLFSYLNKHWVKREKDEGRKNVYNVYTLALVQWRSCFFLPIQDQHSKLISALLKQIEKQRNGETVETTLIKKVIESLVSLGLDEVDSSKQNLDIYQDHFESPFIQSTLLYYKSLSDAFVAANSVTDYLKMSQDRLAEEEARVDVYLHASSRKSLIGACEKALVSDHIDIIKHEFVHLLEFDKEDDLYRIYTLLARVDALDFLRKKFEDHVKRTGLAAIEKVYGNAEASKQGPKKESDKGDLDPKAYVDALLDVHTKCSLTVKNAFKAESGFSAALDKACREVVNRNAATGTSTTKSPELIAKHSDSLLKKGNKQTEEAELEDALNQVMTLFKYIEDKDVFQKFYTKMLAKRLVSGLSASDDGESSMIGKLKDACGFEYTNKLQRMFTDISISKELTNSFNERMTQTHDASELAVDFVVKVLATNFWPMNPPNTQFNMPAELQPTYERFNKYYNSQHSGRKLTWLYNTSKNELKTTHLSQPYIFLCSTFQLAILVQYNEHDSLRYDELKAATNLNDNLLKQTLATLVKSKVLLQDEDTYDLNFNFKSKKIRVQLNQPIKADVKQESSDVLKTVDEDRKFEIQAAVVRIMKARKTLKYQNLIQEVISIVQSRFSPKVSDIKKVRRGVITSSGISKLDETSSTMWPDGMVIVIGVVLLYDNRWTMSEAAKEGRVEKTATYSTRADKRKRKRASLSSEYEAASAGTDGKPMPVSIPAVSSAVSSAQVAREWLLDNFAECEGCEDSSVPRQQVYASYTSFCVSHNTPPAACRIFGKVGEIVRKLFPHVFIRRLGSRAVSIYHYCGITHRSPSERKRIEMLDLQRERAILAYADSLEGIMQEQKQIHSHSPSHILPPLITDSDIMTEYTLWLHSSHCELIVHSMRVEKLTAILDELEHFWVSGRTNLNCNSFYTLNTLNIPNNPAANALSSTFIRAETRAYQDAVALLHSRLIYPLSAQGLDTLIDFIKCLKLMHRNSNCLDNNMRGSLGYFIHLMTGYIELAKRTGIMNDVFSDSSLTSAMATTWSNSYSLNSLLCGQLCDLQAPTVQCTPSDCNNAFIIAYLYSFSGVLSSLHESPTSCLVAFIDTLLDSLPESLTAEQNSAKVLGCFTDAGKFGMCTIGSFPSHPPLQTFDDDAYLQYFTLLKIWFNEYVGMIALRYFDA
ncbi:hypothetical protein E3P86_02110 [Wallemia ichthyophaga]|uniref:Cullin family profile domain-containing protein n=1 Tax=Wallemia ichthyophaga TaxID=245174 RepID=A0A4T0JBU3_WALIC|nr:hypothetical protein E3P86_02110 [Wallemia ichthyophaga]